MSNLKIEYVSKDQLKPYAKNAKLHPADQVDHIANSIREFGFRQPLVIDKDNVIVIGHGRLLAAKKLGLDTVPCVRADDLTEEQIKALRLADNKTNESEWDFDLLDGELDDIFDIDMSEFGFDVSFDDEPQEVVEDEVPEEVETRCKLGDIWQLGQHRLICGDSTDPAVIDRLMDGVKADCVFTDPPYGIDVIGGDNQIGESKLAPIGKYKNVIGDNTTDTAQQAYNILSRICNRLILWGGNYFLDFLPASDGWIIWDKRVDMNGNDFADGEMAWCSFHTPVRIYHQLWSGMIREGEHEKRVHPTQKPVRMLGEVLKDFTSEGEIVLDVFGGSGSTLIACEQLNRKCYMVELDPKYVSVIVNRWLNLTGRKDEIFCIRDGQKLTYDEVFN